MADIKYPRGFFGKNLSSKTQNNAEGKKPKIYPPEAPRITPIPPIKPENSGRPTMPPSIYAPIAESPLLAPRQKMHM